MENNDWTNIKGGGYGGNYSAVPTIAALNASDAKENAWATETHNQQSLHNQGLHQSHQFERNNAAARFEGRNTQEDVKFSHTDTLKGQDSIRRDVLKENHRNREEMARMEQRLTEKMQQQEIDRLRHDNLRMSMATGPQIPVAAAAAPCSCSETGLLTVVRDLIARVPAIK